MNSDPTPPAPPKNGSAATMPINGKKPGRGNGAKRKRKPRRPQRKEKTDVTVLRAFRRFQEYRHTGAVLEHLAHYARAAFLGDDSSPPKYVIATGADTTEMPRADSVMGVQELLLREARKARDAAAEVLKLAIEDLPATQKDLLPADDPESWGYVFGQIPAWDKKDTTETNWDKLQRAKEADASSSEKSRVQKATPSQQQAARSFV
jgi:hypothetical protein